MAELHMDNLPAVKYEATVQADGSIVLHVPFLPGKRVTIFVVQEPETHDSFEELTHASESSLAFWDNPYDDEDWNHA